MRRSALCRRCWFGRSAAGENAPSLFQTTQKSASTFYRELHAVVKQQRAASVKIASLPCIPKRHGLLEYLTPANQLLPRHLYWIRCRQRGGKNGLFRKNARSSGCKNSSLKMEPWKQRQRDEEQKRPSNSINKTNL